MKDKTLKHLERLMPFKGKYKKEDGAIVDATPVIHGLSAVSLNEIGFNGKINLLDHFLNYYLNTNAQFEDLKFNAYMRSIPVIISHDEKESIEAVTFQLYKIKE